MKNKCTLIVDGNWLLMSRVSTMTKKFQKTSPKSVLEGDKNELKRLLTSSLVVACTRFSKVIDNVILVGDYGSWRKHIDKPSCITEDYKGNRVADDDINWDYIYKAFDEIMENCTSLGMTTCRAYHIEGDDWICHWTQALLNQGVNSIIWSTDADLKQLIRSKNGTFVGWWNEKSGLVLPQELDGDNQEADNDLASMMMAGYYGDSVVDRLIKLCPNPVFFNADDILMEKIIVGDQSDNVLPVLTVHSKGRNYKITVRMWNEIKKRLNIANFADFEKNKDYIAQEIISCKIAEKAPKIANLTEVRTRMDYNRKLVWLDKANFPEEVVDTLNGSEYKVIDVNTFLNNVSVLEQTKEEKAEINDLMGGLV